MRLIANSCNSTASKRGSGDSSCPGHLRKLMDFYRAPVAALMRKMDGDAGIRRELLQPLRPFDQHQIIASK